MVAMALFFIVGIFFTLFVATGGAVAWWVTGGRMDANGTKLRQREEARRLQERFEADEDFTRNFHRPTQNELLGTLQALDHLTTDWERGDAALVDHRFKNELAESFPALCKSGCVYPEPVTEDLARLFGKAKLSPQVLENRQRVHTEKIFHSRAAFHAARAQMNALHQINSGPEAGPAEMVPGSLPFRARDEAEARRSAFGSWVGPSAVGFAVVICLAATGIYAADARMRGRVLAMLHAAGFPKGTSALMVKAPENPGVTVKGANGAGEDTTVPTAAGVETTAQGSAAPAGTLPTAADPAAGVAPAVIQTAPAPLAPMAAVPPQPTTVPSLTLAQRIAYSQVRAVEKHPDLAVPNSENNSRFIFRYKKLAAEKSPRLQEPDWPEKLADECAAAAAMGSKSRKLTQASPVRP